MYIRFTQPPADLFDWYEEFLQDEEEIDVKAGGGQMITIGQMCRQFLTKLEWFSTLFPRIPVPIQKQIEQKLNDYDRQNGIAQMPEKPQRRERERPYERERPTERPKDYREERRRSRSRSPRRYDDEPRNSRRSRSHSRERHSKKHHRDRSRSKERRDKDRRKYEYDDGRSYRRY